MILLLACSDPQLDPVREALEAYDLGRAALDAGEAAQAAAHFARAREHDSRTALLPLWQARAVAAGGDAAAAEALATEALRLDPGLGLALYQRAAYRARQGRGDDAAADLAVAMKKGVAAPLQAAADPDFLPLLGTAAFAGLLPPAPVLLDVAGPAGSVFVGSDVELKLAVSAARPLSFSVALEGADPGCMRLERVVEERWPTPGVAVSLVRLRFRALGPCRATVGPFRVDTVEPVAFTATSGTLVVQVDAPSGFQANASSRWLTAIPVPSVLHRGDGDWVTGRVGTLVYALGRPDQPPTLGGAPPELGLELRDIEGGGGQVGTTRALGGAWTSPAPATVLAGGQSYPVP